MKDLKQLTKPRHRPSLLGKAGTFLRAFPGFDFGSRGSTAILIAVLTALAGGRYWIDNHSQTLWPIAPMPEPEAVAANNNAIQSVSLHTAELAAIEDSFTLTGTVVPKNLVRVTPPVNGLQIMEMRVEAGDRVEAGQVLAVLDSSVLRAQLEQVKANLAQAKTEVQQQTAVLTQAQVLHQAAIVDVNRYSSLFESGAISQEQLGDRQVQALSARQQVAVTLSKIESAQANIASKAADINRTEALLAQTTITAPVAGTVAERLTSIGDAVNVGSPIYSLIEAHQLTLALNPSQAQLEQITVGTPVHIRTTDRTTVPTAGPNTVPTSEAISGRVYASDPVLDAQSRQATVKVTLPERPDRLRSGMFLQAEIITDRRQSIVVPAAAVIAQSDGRFVVFSTNDQANGASRVQENIVEVADGYNKQANQVEILSGLTTGSQVVVAGATYLQAGDLVTTVGDL